MGFFDRFSKTFRGKKADEGPSAAPTGSYSTLSLFAPEVNVAPVSPTEFERSVSDGGVAVAEMTDFASPVFVDSKANGGTADYFDTDFEQDLDAVFASLENQNSAQPIISEAADEEMNANDQLIVEQLFADIAATYARPIKNFMFELKRGTAPKAMHA